MTFRQRLWFGLAAVLLDIPTFYFYFTAPYTAPFWVSLVGTGLCIELARSKIEDRATHAEELGPDLSAHGFELVSSTPLPWYNSTGPFPIWHIFSQPYVHTETPIGSGEAVKYRKLVVRDASGTIYTTHALIEFKAFTCSQVLFLPELESLRSKPLVA